MESHNKAAKVISRVLSLPACSGTVKFMTHLQVFLLLLPVFRCVKGIKTVYVCVRVWVFMCMSLVFLFVALCLACSQQCLAFSLMDFFMKLCLMPVCVCVCECVGCSWMGFEVSWALEWNVAWMPPRLFPILSSSRQLIFISHLHFCPSSFSPSHTILPYYFTHFSPN